MEEKIKELRAAIEQASADVTDKARLSDFWQKYLSKNGEVAGLTKSLRDVPKEDRPAVGKTINEFKQWAEAQYQALSEQVEKAALEARNAAETVDITMPAKIRQTGSLHPITLVKNEIIDVFAGMGFEIYEGPEIEDDDHNFTRLNVPKNHPARDMQDTYYLDNGQLMLQPSNTPNGNSEFSAISAKYEVPILFYNHCDYVYREQDSEEEKIKKVDTLVDDYGYNFVQENQLAKMTAAAYNSRVSAKWDNDTLYLSAAAKNEDIPLYDKNYQNSTGVKVIFADGVTVDEFNIDASVAYKKDNCVYASLDKGVKISKNGENKDINITSVNVPAKISKNDKGATIKFCDGGMMTVEVAGNARTTSKGWETTQQEGKTLFRKYGKAETLKITK